MDRIGNQAICSTNQNTNIAFYYKIELPTAYPLKYTFFLPIDASLGA